jgi:membrane protease YdiL (CAAX protease family)
MNKTPYFEKRSLFFRFLILLFLVVFGFSFFSIIGLLLTNSIWETNEINTNPDAIRFFQLITTLGVFLFPSITYFYFEKGTFPKSLTYFKMNKTNFESFLIIIFLSVILIPLISFLGELNRMIHFPESLKELESWMIQLEEKNGSIITLLTQDLFFGNYLKNILIMAVIPAICEEFFFRGALQTYFIQLFKSKHIAILITAIIFSIIHFQFYGFIPRVLLGIYLGYLMIWSGSLLLPIIAHFLHNFLSITIDFIGKSNQVNLDDTNLFEINGIFWFISLALIVVFIGLRKLYLNRVIVK